MRSAALGGTAFAVSSGRGKVSLRTLVLLFALFLVHAGSLRANAIPVTSGLALHFRADAGVGSLSDGDPVSLWQDQSGNGLDLSQATAGQMPTYHTNVLCGLPAIRFDGNDYFTRTSVLGSAFTSTGYDSTIFVVLNNSNDPSASVFRWGTPQRFLLHAPVSGGIYFQFSSSFSDLMIATPAGFYGSPRFIEGVRGTTSGELLIDGSVLDTAPASPWLNTASSNTFHVGTDA